MLRPGNAGSNTTADHLEVISQASEATGLTPRPSRQVQVHVDGAGATNAPVSSSPIGRLFYSIKFTLPDSAPQIYDAISDAAWARHITGQSWDETDITEIIELLYPPG